MAEMPKDWNNHKGWENYYASLYPNGDFADKCFWTGSISLDRVESLAKELNQNNRKTIWISGCGISLLPKALAQRGLKVYATDISPSAIAFQNSKEKRIQDLLDKQILLEINDSGSLISEIQDFRSPYKDNFFDLIINTKSFQGFDKPTMASVAKTHFDSLKPSCNAIFDTMNVQGENRENFEESLVSAGFLIPFYELNCWYRKKLNETGIPYVFVLGNPFIPRFGFYADNEELVEKDTKVLREIAAEFHQKQQESIEQEREKLQSPKAKIATIIYSTG
ncbi:MAG: class I SAM-dependent methyltransferase [Pyrinomonadaceae bacterium]|nr:class I SAM-dependent methyltransferase [Pyrinomonadaceae bacterium]